MEMVVKMFYNSRMQILRPVVFILRYYMLWCDVVSVQM